MSGLVPVIEGLARKANVLNDEIMRSPWRWTGNGEHPSCVPLVLSDTLIPAEVYRLPPRGLYSFRDHNLPLGTFGVPSRVPALTFVSSFCVLAPPSVAFDVL